METSLNDKDWSQDRKAACALNIWIQAILQKLEIFPERGSESEDFVSISFWSEEHQAL